jgi:hypothetical protein
VTASADGNLSAALNWVTAMLRELDVPYQVVGGLAAAAHGATRPLVDIDLYVPDKHLKAISRAAGPRLVRQPQHHRDEHWDLIFMKLHYRQWPIEVAGADSAMVFDRRSMEWTPADIDFAASETIEIEGIPLQVMTRSRLIDYKTGLGREIDDRDVAELSR